MPGKMKEDKSASVSPPLPPPLRLSTKKLSTSNTRSHHDAFLYIWSEQIAYVYRSTWTRSDTVAHNGTSVYLSLIFFHFS